MKDCYTVKLAKNERNIVAYQNYRYKKKAL